MTHDLRYVRLHLKLCKGVPRRVKNRSVRVFFSFWIISVDNGAYVKVRVAGEGGCDRHATTVASKKFRSDALTALTVEVVDWGVNRRSQVLNQETVAPGLWKLPMDFHVSVSGLDLVEHSGAKQRKWWPDHNKASQNVFFFLKNRVDSLAALCAREGAGQWEPRAHLLRSRLLFHWRGGGNILHKMAPVLI